MLHLVPVGRLIIVGDSAHHRCVICKFDHGAANLIMVHVITGKKGTEEGTQTTTLWGGDDILNRPFGSLGELVFLRIREVV